MQINSEQNPSTIANTNVQDKNRIVSKMNNKIKGWNRDITISNELKILDRKISYQTKHFFDDMTGLFSVPFEIIFRNSSNKFEDKFPKLYPDYYTWNIKPVQENELQKYYKMKGEIERSLTEKDKNSILQYWFDDNRFLPYRKYLPFVDMDIISTMIKPYGEQGQIPYIIMEGRLYFYSAAWLNRALLSSLISMRKRFTGRTLTIKFPNLPDLPMTCNSQSFKDWIIKKLKDDLKLKTSKLSILINKIFKIKDSSKIHIDFQWRDNRTLDINLDGVYDSLLEKLWANKGKILLTYILLKKIKK